MIGEFILVIVVVAVLAMITILIVIKNLLLISQPNEVIILSGRKRKIASGAIVGYRIIRGGRALRMPFLEKASRMSLQTIPIDLSVRNAYSKGGIPLVVEAIANIKIDSTEPSFGNAVERFLTMKPDELHNIAKDTLEGNLRGVLASLTPEEVNEDRMKFASTLMDEADIDLQKLGLQLDTLKISNISDETGYLDSIGRRKTAEVLAEARKAEAIRKAEAAEEEATGLAREEKAAAKADEESRKARIIADQSVHIAESEKHAATQEAEALSLARAEKAKAIAKQEIEEAKILSEQNVQIAEANKIANTQEANAKSKERSEIANAKAKEQYQKRQIQADQEIEIERNNLRVKKAELEKEAIIKEKEAEIAGEKAKVKFEQEVEEERIVLQQRRLQADVIEPANARKQAMELEAKGEAASILESGDAQMQVIRFMIDAYKSAGDAGEKVFMLKMLPDIVDKISNTIKDINIDKISIIDSGNGTEGQIPKLVRQMPASVVSMVEMLENATGLDILNIVKNKTEPKERDAAE
jgi:flotillin